MELDRYRHTGKLHQKHLVSLTDYSRADMMEILWLARRYKLLSRRGRTHFNLLRGKTVLLSFNGPSTRSRIACEQAAIRLGASPISVHESDLHFGHGETTADTARALGRYGIAIAVIRTASQADIVDFAKYSGLSVVNGGTRDFLPLQSLADLLTLHDVHGHLKGLKLAIVGRCEAAAHSLILGAARLGIEVACACPPAYAPNPDVIAYAARFGTVSVTDDIDIQVKDANALYTDGFSDGDAEILQAYRVDERMLSLASTGCVFMQHQPAHRNREATANVVDAPYSMLQSQSENYLHVIEALFTLLAKRKK